MEPYIVVISIWREFALSNYVNFIVDESPYEAKKKCLLAHIEKHHDEKYIEKVEAVGVDRKHFLSSFKKLRLTKDELEYVFSDFDDIETDEEGME